MFNEAELAVLHLRLSEKEVHEWLQLPEEYSRASLGKLLSVKDAYEKMLEVKYHRLKHAKRRKAFLRHKDFSFFSNPEENMFNEAWSRLDWTLTWNGEKDYPMDFVADDAQVLGNIQSLMANHKVVHREVIGCLRRAQKFCRLADYLNSFSLEEEKRAILIAPFFSLLSQEKNNVDWGTTNV